VTTNLTQGYAYDELPQNQSLIFFKWLE